MEKKLYTKHDHHIRNDLIPSDALFVLQKLRSAGFVAYLVGGGVRDLLLHQQPKDFDISTSAEPQKIRQLFGKRCLLIGRRFRLAHVRFENRIIEVSTFRSGDPINSELIVEDNLWGTPEEDVLRRDFTINGLFYDPVDHTIIDYVDGVKDLNNKYLKTIGEPLLRFRQDPVRMIRMQKFQARFRLTTDPQAAAALIACREEIKKSSPSRVLEELLRVLESGFSEPFFRLFAESQLTQSILPNLGSHFKSNTYEKIYQHLHALDSINQQTNIQPLDRSIATAALIYPITYPRILERSPLPSLPEALSIINQTIEELLFEHPFRFPRAIRLHTQTILFLQLRLTNLKQRKKNPWKLIRQKHFGHALKFLQLCAMVEPDYLDSYHYWNQLYKQKSKHPSIKRGKKTKPLT